MAASYSSYQLSVIQSLFVISLVSIYLKAPVYLLQQYNSHHLMRKRHTGKRQLKIRPSAHISAQAQTSAYDKSDMAPSTQSQIIHLFSQFFRRKSLPSYLQADYIAALFYMLQDIFAFFVYDCLFIGGRSLIGQLGLSELGDLRIAVF